MRKVKRRNNTFRFSALHKRIFKTFVITVIVTSFVLYTLHHSGLPLYDNWYDSLSSKMVTIIGGVISAFISLFSKSEKKNSAKITNMIIISVVVCISSSILITAAHGTAMALHNKQEREDQQVEENDSSTAEAFADEHSEPESALPSSNGAYIFTATDWENDPFFLNLDKYCGRNVSDYEKEEEIMNLTYGVLTTIDWILYTREELIGSDSEYANYMYEANKCFDIYLEITEQCEHKHKNDKKELKYLEDELNNRLSGDNLLHTSANQKIIGDTYIRIAEYSNPSQALTNYRESFRYFSKSMMTCAAEYLASNRTLLEQMETLVKISDRLLNAAEYIEDHTIANNEDKMGVVVARGLRKAIQKIIEDNKEGINDALFEMRKNPDNIQKAEEIAETIMMR